MLSKLRERRRDAIWSFLAAWGLLAYFWWIAAVGQYLVDTNVGGWIEFVGYGTALILGCASLWSGVAFFINGLYVLITGGSS